MSGPSTSSATIDEDKRRRFEQAWREGSPPQLEQWVGELAGPTRLATLEELVLIDMEMRWKAQRGPAPTTAPPQSVESYLERFPELRQAAIVLRLAKQEYLMRQHFGDRPSASEFQARFPQVVMTDTVLEDTTANAAPARSGGPPQTVGRYRPLRLHARGGLGEVLVAQDEELHREVALKRIQDRHAGDPESRRRFLREAEITGRLEHPGIVPVYGLIQDESGQAYYTMRFIQGESLKEAIEHFHSLDPATEATARRLALRQLLGRFVTVCATIAYAHDRGVVHRDLKPANIMLGKYGETLVVDWGLAKVLELIDGASQLGRSRPLRLSSEDSADDMTQTGSVLGTPAFMSPEQASGHGERVGPASDIYSLGATLYVLLTGKSPFSESSIEATLDKVRRGVFPPPRQIKKEIAPALEAICLRAMAVQPENRYDSARALADDIEKWLADEPVAAYREPLGQRVARWSRRHRTLVSTALVAAFLVLASAVGGVIIWTSQEAERQKEEFARKEAETRRQEAELRAKTQAAQYLSDLRKATEADQKLAEAELQAGRFESANNILKQAIARLAEEKLLPELQAELTRRQAKTEAIVAFYAHSGEAEQIIAEENNAEAKVEAKSTLALEALKVFDHERWWQELPDEGLTPSQKEAFLRDVYRELMLLAAVQAKRGVENFASSENAPFYKASLATIERLHRYRPSRSGEIIAYFCHWGLRQPDKAPPLKIKEPTGSVDAHYLGLLHYWISLKDYQAKPDPITSFALAQATAFTGVDFQNPLAAAERYLRQAARLEPAHYWTSFWLAMTLATAGKFSEAELAANTCASLRPHYRVNYELRVSLLRFQAASEQDAGRKKAMLQEALAALDERDRLHPPTSTTHQLRGQLHKTMGNIPTALACYADAIKADSEVAYLYTERGEIYLEQNEPDKAIADMDQAIRLNPKLPLPYTLRGEALVLKNEVKRALADFDQTLKLQPRFARAYNGRGNAYLQLGDYAKAAAEYTSAIKIFPQYAIYYSNRAQAYISLGDGNKALADCQEGLRREPKNAFLFCLRGEAHVLLGLDAQALADFDQALQLDSTLARAQSGRGNVYYHQNNIDLALKAYSAAIGLAPQVGMYRASRGACYLRRGELDKALADLDKAIQLDSNYVPAWQLRGEVHQARKNWKEAAADFTRAIELDPKGALHYQYRATSCAELGDWAGAGADLDVVLKLTPTDHTAKYWRALLFLHAGNDKAYRDLADGIFRELAAKKDPALTRQLLGLCLLRPDPKWDWGPILPLAEKAAQEARRDPQVLALWGTALYRAGKWKEAYEPLASALDLQSVDAWLHELLLAMTHARLDQKEQARKHYDSALQARKKLTQPAWHVRVLQELLFGEADKLLTR